MKKLILTAFILFACIAGQAQSKQPQFYVGATYGSVVYSLRGVDTYSNATGIDCGVEFFPDSTKRKSFYVSTSFNNFENIIVSYSLNLGITLPINIIKNRLQFYYDPSLSFMNCNNKFNFGIYNGLGFKIIENNQSYVKLEVGLNISKYQYAFVKLIYTFK